MDEKPTHLDLFSGIGGFALAAQWAGFRTIGFCEIDKYCQKVLAKNFMADTASCGFDGRNHIRSGSDSLHEKRDAKENESRREGRIGWISEIGKTAIIPDIFDLDGREFTGVSLITGGFPCQPFSVAGKRRGKEDDRHLWPEMLRVIREARPAWVLGENVPGIIPMELDNVLSDMEGIGYATRAFVIPACAVDARHRRDRLWIVSGNVSDAECNGSSTAEERRGFVKAAGEKSAWAQHALYAAGAGCSPITEGNVSNSTRGRCQQRYTESESARGSICEGSEPATWLAEPDVGRVAHGVPSRVDRLRGLGNAIVPPLAYEILREIRQMIP